MERAESLRQSNPSRRRFLAGAGALFLAGLSGCFGTQNLVVWRAPWTDRPKLGHVGRVEAFWMPPVESSDSARQGMPVVLLRGRVFLFDALNHNELVEGDGTLIVELYDDLQPKDARLPREVWRFTPDKAQAVFRKGNDLGWGYSLALPWSNYHPDIRMIAINARYISADGVEHWASWTRIPVNDGVESGWTVQESKVSGLPNLPQGNHSKAGGNLPPQNGPAIQRRGP